MRYHLPKSEWLLSKSQEITSVGENVHRRWDCKLMQPLWKTAWRFPKKLKIDISYNPAIPLLGIYPKKTKTLIQKDTCTTMFTVALFTTAKIWKQPKCPLTDDGMDKDGVHVWNITSHKTNEILPFATTRMNLENIMRSQISQTEKETHQMISLIWESKEQNK